MTDDENETVEVDERERKLASFLRRHFGWDIDESDVYHKYDDKS